MTYHKQGLIQATTYNAFAAILNSIYYDTNSGSTAENSEEYGYGQQPSVSNGFLSIIPNVAIGNNITAAQWSILFNIIHLCATHQGYGAAPIPSSVSPGNLIAAYNDYLTTQTLTNIIGQLLAHRLTHSVSQMSIISPAGSPQSNSTSWIRNLKYSFQVDFGSWDNARHFFNSSGAILIFGSHVAGSIGSDDTFWHDMLAAMGTLAFRWHDTSPSVITGGPGSNIGFYDLDFTATTWTEVYRRSSNAVGSYSNNYISIFAKYNAAPPLNGKIDFRIELIDNDPGIAPQTTATSFSIQLNQAAGVIPYEPSHPAVIYNPVGFALDSFINPVPIPGVALTLTCTTSPAVANASINGPGVATTPSITIVAAGGTAPYFYSWSYEGAPVSFTNPTSATTTFYNTLVEGDIVNGSAVCTVTDSTPGTPNVSGMEIEWSMNSNWLNP